MKIVERTADRLVLAERPTAGALVQALMLAGLIAGGAWISPFGFQGLAAILPAVAGGAILVYVFARGARLTLDRSADRFVLWQASVFGRRKRVMPLGALAGATLQRSRGPARYEALRLALILRGPTGHTEVAPSPIFTRRTGPDRAAEAINSWLAQSDA